MIPSSEMLSAPISAVPRRRLAQAGRSGAARGPRTAPLRPVERVYIASPLSTYRTPRYDAKLDQIRERYPDATLLPARDLFRSTADWRARWPALLPTLSELVFFTEIDGTIGLGVWSELHDAADQLPVWYLDDAARWFPLEAITITVTGESLSRFAMVEVIDQLCHEAPDPSVLTTGGG